MPPNPLLPRLGPRPLPLHLGTALMTWASSESAWRHWKPGSPNSKPGSPVPEAIAALLPEIAALEAQAGSGKFESALSREIARRIGPHLSLHGVSSVDPNRLDRLFEDGIGKVNFWTALERDSAATLLSALLEHAAESAGPTMARELQQRGLLGFAADITSPVSLDYCTTRFRQGVVFESMKRIVTAYLTRWCPV